MRRKQDLVTGEYYYVFNKSIAGYRLFHEADHFLRMKQMMKYYQLGPWTWPFCHFMRLPEVQIEGFWNCFEAYRGIKEKQVDIVSYCIMPTHVHFILRQLKANGIATFMGNVLNSYSRYFNIRYHRSGPLWQSRYKSVLVRSDDQLLHLSRYIHLNPVTAFLVSDPQDWPASSYEEYLRNAFVEEEFISRPFFDKIDGPSDYKRFVEEEIPYQRELAKSRTH